jgi:hypothetical protein
MKVKYHLWVNFDVFGKIGWKFYVLVSGVVYCNNNNNLMLKLCEVVSVTKNPYHARPLPHIIGSKEWNEDDRVGLGTEDEIKGNC